MPQPHLLLSGQAIESFRFHMGGPGGGLDDGRHTTQDLSGILEYKGSSHEAIPGRDTGRSLPPLLYPDPGCCWDESLNPPTPFSLCFHPKYLTLSDCHQQWSSSIQFASKSDIGHLMPRQGLTKMFQALVGFGTM
jgi:hypothetical protein